MDDLAALRRRMDGIEAAAYARADDALDAGARTLVGRVVDGGSMPTSVPGNFLVTVGTLDGVEAVGQPVGFDASSWDTAVVLVLGPEVPAAGDLLVADLIQGRWVAQRGGASGTCAIQVVTLDAVTDADLPGVSVSVKDADGTAIGTATTDFAGRADIDIPASGKYRVTFVMSGYPTVVMLYDAPCTGGLFVARMGVAVSGTIYGCNDLVTGADTPGVDVRVTIGGRVYLGTTGASGTYLMGVAEYGTGTVEYTRYRFQAHTQAVSVTAPGTAGLGIWHLVPLAGYRCFLWNESAGQYCYAPISETLHLTDPAQGAVTLTFDAAEDAWMGTKVGSPAAYGYDYPGCANTSATLHYRINRLSGSFGGSPNPPLAITWQTSPTGFGMLPCPDDAGDSGQSLTASASGPCTCPPAFLSQLYSGSLTFTITE